jgi:hypothetical protein
MLIFKESGIREYSVFQIRHRVIKMCVVFAQDVRLVSRAIHPTAPYISRIWLTSCHGVGHH